MSQRVAERASALSGIYPSQLCLVSSKLWLNLELWLRVEGGEVSGWLPLMESLRRGWPLPLRRRHSCSQSASPPIICCAHTFPPPWWSSILLRTLEFVFFAEILEWLNKLRYKCPADFNSVYPKNCKHTIPNGTQGAAFEISVERLKFSSSIIKALTSTFSLVLLRNFSVCPFVLRK